MIYAKSNLEKALRQGELLSNVAQYLVNVDATDTDSVTFRERVHELAFVLSQDCDLDWDFNSRKNDSLADRRIPSVLFCKAQLATVTARTIVNEEGSRDTKKSRIWNRVKINKDERYQFFSTIPADVDLQGEGINELVVDFKRYFTVPTDELYRRIAEGETQRRCRLNSPYLEHLSSRFAYFLSRVALPEDYQSEPGVVRRDNSA